VCSKYGLQRAGVRRYFLQARAETLQQMYSYDHCEQAALVYDENYCPTRNHSSKISCFRWNRLQIKLVELSKDAAKQGELAC
jgi:hypothetical protein